MKRFLIALVLLFVAILLMTSWTRVASNELAVLDPRFGDPEILQPGFHLRMPILSRVTHYSLSPQKSEGEVRVKTRDNFTFPVRYEIETKFEADTLLNLHARRAGRDLRSVLRQLTDESVEAASAYLRADEVLGTINQERWRAVLTPACRERGLAANSMTILAPAPKVIVNAALLYQRRKLPNAALQLLNDGLEREGDNAHLRYGLGRVLEMQGKEEEAEDQYVQALFLEPAAQEPMGRLVGLLLKKREFERARRLIQAALLEDNTSSAHLNWLGVTLQLEAKYDEARAAFEQALTLDPENAETHANLGALLLATGDNAGAQDAFKEAIRISPDHTLALYNLGVALAQEERVSEAIPFLERAENSGPPSVGLMNALAQAYKETNQLPKAVEALRKSLSLDPNQAKSRKMLSDLEKSVK